MARDSGRYDAITQTWIDQQERVDFAWGNVPLQSNIDRGANVLDPVLDSHEIAYLGWNGFPEFTPNTTGSGGSGSGSGGGVTSVVIPQIAMPESFESYLATLQALGLNGSLGSPVENTIGSNLDGQVTEVVPAPGTSVPVGTTVTVREYGVYVAPSIFGPTTDWTYDGMSNQWKFPETALPSVLTAAPGASYKLVMTGGNFAGEYIITQAGTDIMFMTERVITATRPTTSPSYYRGAGLADNAMYAAGYQEDAGSITIEPYVAPALLGTNRTNWYFNSGSLYIKDLFSLPTELDANNKDSHLLIITGGQLDGAYPLSAASVIYDSMSSAVRIYNNNTNTSAGSNWNNIMNQLKGSTYVDNMGMQQLDAGVVKFVLAEIVQVPDLTGLTASQAAATLESLGLVPNEQPTFIGTNMGNPINLGSVSGQLQISASTAYKGTVVTYYVYSSSITVDLEPGSPYLIDMGGVQLRLANYSVTNTSPVYIAANQGLLAGKTLTFNSNNLVATDNMGMNVGTSSIVMTPWPITSASASFMMGPEVGISLGGGITNPAPGGSSLNFTSGTITIS